MTSLTIQQGQQQLLYLNKAHDFSLAQPTHHSKHSKTNKVQCIGLCVSTVKQSNQTPNCQTKESGARHNTKQ